ncbi:hypothetical protein [Priestia megaterium]|uniref:Uncharacterized protein n=1 Tax=Priestia megaterium TaxID=1404 RepID=A0A6M6E0T2_PRIMG|nr:hypothetical protein [Priestia megaterium]QJX80440.1 hypothetical protein FDZ14_30600 [Priestia megaterium]
MRKLLLTVIFVLYCVPYVYLSMHNDFASHSMFMYGIMLIATIILAVISGYLGVWILAIIGNIVSLILSVYFNNKMISVPKWEDYFVPLFSVRLLILVTCLIVILQIVFYMVGKQIKQKKSIY